MANKFDPKLEDDDENFSWNFSLRLATGRTIASADVSSSPSGLTLGTPSVDGAVVSVRVSGGTGGTSYHVECLATLDDGETVGHCAIIKVKAC